ncbi:MAG: YrdB family protein [Cytophagaceae bacterium]|nr:YrdB family protein [Cytophagaceae bacterium]
MQIIKLINHPLAFGLELVLFFGVGYWGYFQGKITLAKWGIAILCFMILVILWALFAAPKSGMRLKYPMLNIFKLLIFSAGTFAFWNLGKTWLAIVYTLLFILSVGLSYLEETS